MYSNWTSQTDSIPCYHCFARPRGRRWFPGAPSVRTFARDGPDFRVSRIPGNQWPYASCDRRSTAYCPLLRFTWVASASSASLAFSALRFSLFALSRSFCAWFLQGTHVRPTGVWLICGHATSSLARRTSGTAASVSTPCWSRRTGFQESARQAPLAPAGTRAPPCRGSRSPPLLPRLAVVAAPPERGRQNPRLQAHLVLR